MTLMQTTHRGHERNQMPAIASRWRDCISLIDSIVCRLLKSGNLTVTNTSQPINQTGQSAAAFMSDPYIQELFAGRIGGNQYGKSTAIYKFER